MINKYLWGSLIFFIGCLCNLFDSIITGGSILVKLSAVLFVVGSIFFIYDAYNKINFEKSTEKIIQEIKMNTNYNRAKAEVGAYKIAPEGKI